MTEEQSPHAAIRCLYDLYADDIYRYAKMTLLDRVDAYDVVQEVFLRAFRAYGTYRSESSAQNWLMRIARNYIYDLFRKKRLERKFLSGAKLRVQGVSNEVADYQGIMEVQDMLASLKDEYRHVLTLRYIEQLSVSETANVLNWSEQKVRTTAHRALQKLRTTWGGVIGDELETKNY